MSIPNARAQLQRLLRMEILSTDDQNKKIDLLAKAVLGLYAGFGVDLVCSADLHGAQVAGHYPDCDCAVCEGVFAARKLANLPKNDPPGDFTLTVPE